MSIEILENARLLMIYLPEPVRLLIFGAGLIGLTVLLRGALERIDHEREKKKD